ncbi:MAG: hypothetical protein NC314_12505 [Roseburia sp.]|nr:hypothetical protein [Roseburia sp.]MCM1243656.1 hypothetical protein [Roseburia sp.]
MKKYLLMLLTLFTMLTMLTGCAGSLPPGQSAAYTKLISYKTDDYLQQSITDFNATLAPTYDDFSDVLAAMAEVAGTIPADDENYDFITQTMTFSAQELFNEHMGEGFTFMGNLQKRSRPYKEVDSEGEPIYAFNCFVEFQVDYEILLPDVLTVAERDAVLLNFRTQLQDYLDTLREEEITEYSLQKMLSDKAAELTEYLSSDRIRLLPCEFYLIEIYGDAEPEDVSEGADASLSWEERQKLQALELDGYEEMSIAEFQKRIWMLTDTQEYCELLEHIEKNEAWYEKRDNDEMAAFCFYILEPLTGDKWKNRDYGGCATSGFPYPADNAVLEYVFTLTVLNADTLTVGEYDNTRLQVISGMQDILSDRTVEELQNESFMAASVQDGIDRLIQQLQTEEIGIHIEYAYFPLTFYDNSVINDGLQNMQEQENREFPNGTQEDYRSLFALKTPGYRDMTLADFNSLLLEWANENYERMERVGEDTARNDFKVSLTAEELDFVKLTVFLSGMENGAYVQSVYTGRPEKDPIYDTYLSEKTEEENGMAAWCDLYYRFSYHIADRNTVTVGERDHQIAGMINAVEDFWENTDTECLLQMSESDIVKELEKIAAEHSNAKVTITTDKEQIQFERMDERGRRG